MALRLTEAPQDTINARDAEISEIKAMTFEQLDAYVVSTIASGPAGIRKLIRMLLKVVWLAARRL